MIPFFISVKMQKLGYFIKSQALDSEYFGIYLDNSELDVIWKGGEIRHLIV